MLAQVIENRMTEGMGQGIDRLDVVYVIDIQSTIVTSIGQCY